MVHWGHMHRWIEVWGIVRRGVVHGMWRHIILWVGFVLFFFLLMVWIVPFLIFLIFLLFLISINIFAILVSVSRHWF